MGKTNKDVLTIEHKQEKRLYIKMLRQWGKINNTSQFDMALFLVSLFHRGFGACINYIQDKQLSNDFDKYLEKLEGNYYEVFEQLETFAKSFDSAMIPKFGE